MIIELAIFINMSISFYTGTVLSFITSIVISTIQLGATVDYAILMTNRYLSERSLGKDKKTATTEALANCAPSVLTSALGFFAATIGVAIYSDVDLISSLCLLIARGALISMALVLLLLPSFFLTCDGLIIRTSRGVRRKMKQMEGGVR
jgi:predicted RND superfamily exporter protein